MLIGGGVIVAGILLWAFVRYVSPDPEADRGGEAATAVERRAVAEPEIEGLATSDLEELASAFLQADSVEALLEIVDQPELSEARMRAFYADAERHPLPMGGSVAMLAELEYQEELIYGLIVDGLFGSRSMLPMMEGADGKPTIRWEWAVGWMEREWKEIVAARSEQPSTVKVFAWIDDYYNYDYRDESKWLCLRLGGRDMETFCYAYVAKSSPGIEPLMTLDAAAPVRLTIRFAPGSQPNQAEVVEFHNVGWMGD